MTEFFAGKCCLFIGVLYGSSLFPVANIRIPIRGLHDSEACPEFE